jgi:hopene-associated glycosyltransferase HpnB
MTVLLLFLLSMVATLAFLGWAYILFHPARPWDFQPVGDDVPLSDLPAVDNWPPVCILVPARNESEALPNTLPALLSQDYPGEFKIILIDDRSDDGTSEVARGIAEKLGKSERLNILRGQPLPEGWIGKVWALHQGAQSIAGQSAMILLTDADILHAPTSLRRLVCESQSASLGLNSRMARLRCHSPAERLLIPAFVYFFNLLYPMRWVNDPRDPIAGAAGGCVLLSAEALKRLGGGFESIKSEIIDDVNLARQVKRAGLPIRLSLSRSEVQSLRDYPVLSDIWKMVRRTAFTELRYSWLRLIGALLGLTLLFIVPVIAVLCGSTGLILATDVVGVAVALWALVKGMLSLAIMRRVYGPAVRFFNLDSYYAYTLPMAGTLYGLMTLDSALRHARGRRLEWREAATTTPKANLP